MTKSKIVIYAAIVLIIFSLCMNASEQRVGEGEILRPKATEKPPKIDGNLDDPAWQSGPVVPALLSPITRFTGRSCPKKQGCI